MARPVTSAARADGTIPAARARGGSPAGPAPAVRRADPALPAAGHTVDPRLAATGAHAVAAATTVVGSVRPIARAVARHPTRVDDVDAVRTQRRGRVPWGLLPRPRLAAAWGAVQRECAGRGELSLIGVYGPLRLDAIASAALEPDGRLAVTLDRGGCTPVLGDVALARVEPGHHLVRCDLPYPTHGRRGHLPR